MLTIIQDFTSDRDIQNTERVAVAVASLTGIFQNTSWWSRVFPTAWRFFIWYVDQSLFKCIVLMLSRMKVMVHDIPRYFLSSIGWKILRDLSTADRLYDAKDSVRPLRILLNVHILTNKSRIPS